MGDTYEFKGGCINIYGECGVRTTNVKEITRDSDLHDVLTSAILEFQKRQPCVTDSELVIRIYEFMGEWVKGLMECK